MRKKHSYHDRTDKQDYRIIEICKRKRQKKLIKEANKQNGE